jgi:acyl-coenzyme A thioesterase PaaI-like protein
MQLIDYPPDAALQDVWQNATCYGCGPANRRGLHIKSYWDAENDEAYASFTAQPYHNAGFPNVLHGGLIASLCDCHSVWAAIAYTYLQEGRPFGSAPAISYVTANLNVSFLAPTPLMQPITLRARVEALAGRKATIFCYVHDGAKRTAEARLVAVRIEADKSIGYAEGRG